MDSNFKLAIFTALSLLLNALSGICGEQENTLVAYERSDFWGHFQETVLSPEWAVQNASVLTAYGVDLIRENQESKFANQAATRLAVKMRMSGLCSEALDVLDLALELPETHVGNHMRAWHTKAECLRVLGDNTGAAEASEEVLNYSEPTSLAQNLHQLALVRKADIILLSPDVVRDGRRIAEAALAPLTEIPNGGPGAEYRGQLVRARFLNLKEMGQLSKAERVAKDFLNDKPCDPWAPVIAVDLTKITEHLAKKTPLEHWLKFFRDKGCSESAGLAILKYTLMNTYTREEMYDEAIVLGRELMTFKKAEADPVSWSDHYLESIKATIIVASGAKERANNGVDRKAYLKFESKRSPLLIFIVALLACGPIIFLVLYRKKLL